MNAVEAPIAVDPAILKRLGCSLEDIAKLCREYQVVELSVFGSVVRDDFDAKKSDVDFLYVFSPDSDIGWSELYYLRTKLSELVHRKIDLVSKTWMGSDFEKNILPHAKVIYAD